MTTELDTLISQLALARTAAEKAREVVRLMTRNFQESPEFVAAAAVSVGCGANEATLDAALRDYAVKQYGVDDNKHPHEKVEIKIFPVVKLVKDKIGDLREWLFTNLRPGLKLDEARCIDFAKKGDIPAEFYESYSEPRVQIASKL